MTRVGQAAPRLCALTGQRCGCYQAVLTYFKGIALGVGECLPSVLPAFARETARGLPGRCLMDATSFQPISVTTLWPTTAECKVGTFGRVLRSPVGSAARTNTSTRDVVPRAHPVLHTCVSRVRLVTQGRGLLVALCPQHAGLSRPSCGSTRQLPDLLCAPGKVSLPGL